MKRHTKYRSVFTPALLAAVASPLLFVAQARAQELVLPPQPAPPPMKYIPDAERTRLDAARDAKERVRSSLELADERLRAAEQQTAAQRYDAAAAQLGVYQAILDDALEHLQQLGKNDGKTRDLFRRLELSVYRFGARLEAMRRVTPNDYAGNVRAALNHARDMRTDALNSFYGNTVLRSEPPVADKPKPPAGARPKEEPPATTPAPNKKESDRPLL